MKIGLSYSRCVRDIVDGRVDIDDVLVIIARTDFDPNDDTQWSGIWDDYGGGQRLGGIFGGHEWMDYSAEDETSFDRSVLTYGNRASFISHVSLEPTLHVVQKFG